MAENYDDKHRWLKMPLGELTTPKPGRMCMGPRWWAVVDDGGVGCVLFFQSGSRGRGGQYGSPQCNTDRAIVERLRPGCTPVFVEMAFVPHNQWEYE
jgi:hypothetical protein